MLGLRYLGRLWMVILIIWAATPLMAHSEMLHTPTKSNAEVCTWQGVNSLWSSPINWSCGHVPTDANDVGIGAAGAAPVLSSNTTVKSVSVSGNSFTVNSSGVLNVNETFTAQGDATVTVTGAINMTLLQVTAGTLQTNGTWNGDVEIALPAKLTLKSNMTVSGDVVVYGTLDDQLASNYTLFFGGDVFRNDGAVRVSNVKFNRLGEQTIVGSGEWSGDGEIRTESGSTALLANDLTLDTELYIEGDSSVDLGGHTLAINGTSLYSMCLYSEQPSRLSGAGLLRIQGSMSLEGCAEISPDLEVVGGTATISASPAVFSGTVSVLEGAALEVTTASFTVHGDMTVAGTLAGSNPEATVTFYGDQFTNDGAVSVTRIKFTGPAQTLGGSGYFAKDSTATIRPATTLTLGSDHQMGEIWIESMGTFDLAGRRLGLSGSNASGPLTVGGTAVTAGSTIIYNGVETQTLANLNVHYHHLIISNTVAVDAPDENVSIGGDFTNQGIFRPGNGTLTFDGVAPQAIRGSATSFADLVIDNPLGVNLETNASVEGTLTLNGDLFTGNNVLTASGTSTGAFDVFGRVRRTDLALGVARSFGNPFVTLTFDSGAPPAEITITLRPSPPTGLPASVQRSYSIAASGGSGYAATMRLHYRDSELNGLAEDNLGLWKLEGGMLSWRSHPTTAWDHTDNWVESSGVTSFSSWALAAGNWIYLPFVVR